MAIVELRAMDTWVKKTLLAAGMTQENAITVAEVVMRATLRGMGHHDIYDFPGHVFSLLSGAEEANPKFTLLSSYGGMESWDGGNGLGELTCSFAMERAMESAKVHGIGLCAIRGSNHYLAAAPYVEKASEKGYIGILMCKGAPTMGAPNRTEKVIGTLPMGYAFPTDRSSPVIFDACMAYASFGALKKKIDSKEEVPPYWGYDENGDVTTDPVALSKGTRLPIGGHKGFGLALLGEVLTAVLSDGCVIDEPDIVYGQKSPTSHTAIAIKADALTNIDRFEEHTGEMIVRMKERAPGLHIPGEGARAKSDEMAKSGRIELKDDLLTKLDEISEKLQVAKIVRK